MLGRRTSSDLNLGGTTTGASKSLLVFLLNCGGSGEFETHYLEDLRWSDASLEDLGWSGELGTFYLEDLRWSGAGLEDPEWPFRPRRPGGR